MLVCNLLGTPGLKVYEVLEPGEHVERHFLVATNIVGVVYGKRLKVIYPVFTMRCK
jgi:hypothetical protein